MTICDPTINKSLCRQFRVGIGYCNHGCVVGNRLIRFRRIKLAVCCSAIVLPKHLLLDTGRFELDRIAP